MSISAEELTRGILIFSLSQTNQLIHIKMLKFFVK